MVISIGSTSRRIEPSSIPDFIALHVITNLSLFKEYLEGFCSAHPGLQNNLGKLIRFLQPDEKGLPLEIIVFSKYQDAVAYEKLQDEIFNHILAILPEFELRVFQAPYLNAFRANT